MTPVLDLRWSHNVKWTPKIKEFEYKCEVNEKDVLAPSKWGLQGPEKWRQNNVFRKTDRWFTSQAVYFSVGAAGLQNALSSTADHNDETNAYQQSELSIATDSANVPAMLLL